MLTTRASTGQQLANPQQNLVGLDKTFKRLKARCERPDLSWQNALYTAVFANGAAGNVIENLGSKSIPESVLYGGTVLTSGAVQFQEFCKHHWKIQELQEAFIRALPLGEVLRYGSDTTSAAFVTPATTAEDIVNSLYKEKELHVYTNKMEFELKNNGIYSRRVVGAAVSSLVLSALFASIYIAYHTQQAIIEADAASNNGTSSNNFTSTAAPNNGTASENTLPEASVYGTLVISSLPITKVWTVAVAASYRQEFYLFKAAKDLIEAFYADKLDEVPDGVMGVINHFLDEDSKEENKKTIDKIEKLKLTETMDARVDQKVGAITTAFTQKLDETKAKLEATEQKLLETKEEVKSLKEQLQQDEEAQALLEGKVNQTRRKSLFRMFTS